MKRRFFLFLLITNSLWLTAFSQSVGIGTNTPDPSALLDLNSSDKGLLIPRMTFNKRDGIANPAKGLMVYTADDSSFYMYDGTWRRLVPADEVWNIRGNNGIDTSVHFIGTIDDKPVKFKVNNNLRMQLDDLGRLQLYSPGNNLFMGYKTGINISTGIQNHFTGYEAGLNNTSGTQNYFSGYQAGYSNTTSSDNHFEGYSAGKNNTGHRNHFVGFEAGFSNTTAEENHFEGYNAGRSNTIGAGNEFIGYKAGVNNTTGWYNQFIGYYAGFSNTTGNFNLFEGYRAGLFNTTGSYNHFNGYAAGANNTTGTDNYMSGNVAGFLNTTGNSNCFAGNLAGYLNVSGSYNYFNGYSAGFHNTTASENYCSGYGAGYKNTTGTGNHYEGYVAGFNSIGSRNHFSGYRAGYANGSGSNNTLIGYHADVSDSTLTNAGAIGYNARVSQNNSFVIGGLDADAVNVGIGTTAPQTKLDVNSNALYSIIATFRSTGGYGQINVTEGTTVTDLGSYATGGYTGTNSAGDFKIRTGAIDRMFFKYSTGYVGIGTNSPSEKLHVAGNIAMDGIIVNEAFQTPVFEGSWTNYTGYSNAAFYKGKEGRVHLRGVVYNTGTVVGTVIFTLPPGYRPSTSGNLILQVLNNNIITRVDVLTNGDIKVITGSSGWFSLDGISFRAD